MKQVSQRVVAILGMHRSGTSALAGSLEEAGLALGDVSKQNPYNLKGNQENPRIMDLHQDLLTSNGGNWDAPPTRVRWSAEQRQERDEIIASYSRYATWGFKDPRTILTLAGWREALPGLLCVATFRHPAAVATSLQKRDSMSLSFKRGLELWVHYSSLLLRARAALGFDLICFDLPRREYLQRLQLVARNLGLAPPAAGFRFFADDLRHPSRQGDHVLDSETARIYGELQGTAV